MIPDGVGELYIAYEQLKKQLEEEGLFRPEHKKPIPKFPKRVGVVTASTGAAVRDIINVITRRYPMAEIVIYPAQVQGVGAAESVVKAIEYFNATNEVDTLIVGRGGGSIEDLWAFNEEITARAIFNSKIPIISAVGHETDFTIARHAYGDVYKGSEMKIPGAGKVELVYTAEDGSETKELVHNFDGPGIVQGMHNINRSIESFARSCFSYALDTKQDLWFATKDTISKKYDHTFKDIFQEIYDAEFDEKFKEAGIEYFYTLIDDAVARVMKSEGGYIWACKNYDGDVMSDMVSSAFGSLAMMTSVLVSPEGYYEYEAAHGTVQRHYYKHLKGEETSTNSVATIFAWTGALRKRGELDGNTELMEFADKLEKATIDTIEAGEMTKDLALITTLENPTVLNSEQFIKAIAKRL